MKQLSVLLLEGNKLAELAADLRNILRSTTQLGVDLHCEPIDFSGTAILRSNVETPATAAPPDVRRLALAHRPGPSRLIRGLRPPPSKPLKNSGRQGTATASHRAA
jgi:hypothetical protein